MKVLATLDGSPLSEEVVPFATTLAKETSGTLLLLIVAKAGEGIYRGAEPPSADAMPSAPTSTTQVMRGQGVVPIETTDQAYARAEADATDYLARIAAPARAQGVPVDTKAVISENVVPAILEAARTARVDLIAMTTHGRSGLRAAVQGSVASAVVRAGEFPVLLVRPGTKPS